MGTPLSLCAKLWDLNASAIATIDVQRANLTTHAITTVTGVAAVATHNMITQWALGKRVNSAGTVRLGVTFGNAFANAVIAAMGGASYTSDPLPYLVLLYRDGGTTPVSLCWLKGVSINPGGPNRGILIETPDLFEGMSYSDIDHMTFNGATLADVLTAAAGAVKVNSAGTPGGTTYSTGFYPIGVRGLDNNIPLAPSMRTTDNLALCTFTFIVSATPTGFHTTAINSDNWAVSVADALLTVMRAAGGKYDSTDTAPLGARAHYHVDIANMIVNCGDVGTTPVLELVSDIPAGTYELDESAQSWFDIGALTINPGNEAAKAQYERTGGASNHGLPDGWANTGLEILFPDAGDDDAWLHLQIVSGMTGTDGGGVYCNLHDGLLRPISQAFDATCMAYDGTSKAVVVGTPYGVLSYTPDTTTITDLPTTLPTWAQLGGLSQPIKALCIPAENIVWALADEGNGSISVFQYPAISGDDNTDLGFPGWSRIHQGTVLFMAGGTGNLYYVDSADPTILLLAVPGADAVPVDMSAAAGAGIVGLDYLPGLASIAIRTTAGSAHILLLALGSTTPTDLNPGGTGAGGLADQYGYLQVYRIQESGAASLNGTSTSLLASTDQGGYLTASGTPSWKQMTFMAGVGDRSVQFIAASPTQTVLGRSFERVYFATASNLWVSNTGGSQVFDLLAANLDEGPVWTACAQNCTGGTPWPPNTIGALAPSSSDSTLTGENGAVGSTAIFIPDGYVFDMPANYVWCRRLTARNDFTYRTVKVDSAAPYFAIDMQALSEVTADDSTPAIPASEQLKLASWRSMASGQANPLTLPLTGMTYRTQESALATLITGNLIELTANKQQVGPDGTITQVVDWDHLGVYVLTYDEVKDGSIMKVSITAGTKMALLDDPATLLTEITAGTSYEVGRINKYK